MRALILAAGTGCRMGNGHPPKSLLRFAGKTLLRRHVEILSDCGVTEIVVGVGYRAEMIEAELQSYNGEFAVRLVHNADYHLGNIVTLWTLGQELLRGGDVLVMDADVLYDYRLIHRLVSSAHGTCFLLDRNLDPGDEPVKICVRDQRLVELRKHIDDELEYDFHGESVGFFRLAEPMARRLYTVVEDFMRREITDVLYEEALRALLRSEHGHLLGYEDVTGLPWTEIDFPDDVSRAEAEIMPILADRSWE